LASWVFGDAEKKGGKKQGGKKREEKIGMQKGPCEKLICSNYL